jgi:hypothetical protein
MFVMTKLPNCVALEQLERSERADQVELDDPDYNGDLINRGEIEDH